MKIVLAVFDTLLWSNVVCGHYVCCSTFIPFHHVVDVGVFSMWHIMCKVYRVGVCVCCSSSPRFYKKMFEFRKMHREVDNIVSAQ